MRGGLVAVVIALVVVGCLKAGHDDQESRGGVVVVLVPSAATKGAPFVTPDGWTITIHKLVLRLAAGAATYYPDGGEYNAENDVARILAPTLDCHLQFTGADEGLTAKVVLVTSIATPAGGDPFGELPSCGVDLETLNRFNALSDDSDAEFPSLPSYLVAATATREGRSLEVSFTGSGNAFSDPDQAAEVVIQANVGLSVSFPINAELLFAPTTPDGVTFDEIAASDIDGDGTVTGAELAVTALTCTESGDGFGGTYCTSVLDEMTVNVSGIFGPGAPP